jgi:hypothetical protein
MKLLNPAFVSGTVVWIGQRIDDAAEFCADDPSAYMEVTR